MSSANEIALNEIETLDEDLSFDEIEESLKAELDVSFEELALLESDRETIENPDSLVKVIADELMNKEEYAFLHDWLKKEELTAQ